jgi:hypothetical protein
MVAATKEPDALEESLEKGVEAVAGGLKRGFSGAKSALDVPSGAALESLIEGTDLPELGERDALGALAMRLDRESDLMRNVALRELTRVAWSDRIAQTVAVFAAIANLGLAVVAVPGALVGGEHTGERALLVVAASIALFSGGLLVWIVARSGSRRAVELARETLARAHATELRLERVALLLATREADPKAFKTALARSDRAPTRHAEEAGAGG